MAISKNAEAKIKGHQFAGGSRVTNTIGGMKVHTYQLHLEDLLFLVQLEQDEEVEDVKIKRSGAGMSVILS